MELPPEDIIELFKKTLDIKNYENIDELCLEINNMCKESDDSINNFKDILIELTDILCNLNTGTLIYQFKDDIKRGILKDPKKILDTFIKYCYLKDNGKYRKELIMGNDKFFINNDYLEYCKDDNIISKIFELKSFWNNISDENKYIIKSFWLTLCYFADKRFILYYKFNEIKRKFSDKYNFLLDIII